jgi:hypothetical protein
MEAMQRLIEQKQELLSQVFMGMSAGETAALLANREKLGMLVMGAAFADAQGLAETLSILTGIPAIDILEDENIGLDGVADIFLAWWNLNGVDFFLRATADLADKAKGTPLMDGLVSSPPASITASRKARS